jgi:hypothetical protein
VYAEATGGAARVGFNGTVWSNTGTTLGVTVNGRDCTDSELNDHHFQNIAGIANGEWALYRGGRLRHPHRTAVRGTGRRRCGRWRERPGRGPRRESHGRAGRQSWRTVPADITGLTGRQDVYLTSTSGQPADFVNVNWIRFGS